MASRASSIDPGQGCTGRDQYTGSGQRPVPAVTEWREPRHRMSTGYGQRPVVGGHEQARADTREVFTRRRPFHRRAAPCPPRTPPNRDGGRSGRARNRGGRGRRRPGDPGAGARRPRPRRRPATGPGAMRCHRSFNCMLASGDAPESRHRCRHLGAWAPWERGRPHLKMAPTPGPEPPPGSGLRRIGNMRLCQ